MREDFNAQSTLSSARLSVTQKAVQRIAFLLQDKTQGSYFRVSVEGGGCSGFQYHFSFDSEATVDDLKIEKAGAKILVDEVSFKLLAGAEIDYEEDLMGAMFVIKNPQASSRCGCGNSFSI